MHGTVIIKSMERNDNVILCLPTQITDTPIQTPNSETNLSLQRNSPILIHCPTSFMAYLRNAAKYFF